MNSCSGESRSLEEPLRGTGVVAEQWLCVESRAQWGRDPIGDGEVVIPAGAAPGATVYAIRRHGRSLSPRLAFSAVSAEAGGELRVHVLEDGSGELSAGEVVPHTLFLVCAHGRRDPCCSRLGLPVYKLLDVVVDGSAVPLVWQCSHTGGHRFAPNIVALPWGVTLGRVPHDQAPEIAKALDDGRVPLPFYRGRSIYPADVQAAEVAIRQAGGFDCLEDLRLLSADDGVVVFSTPAGDAVRRVTAVPGPTLRKSCGAEPEQVTTFEVRET